MFPESNTTNANFTRTNNTQSLVVANLVEMETVNFQTAVLFGWEKSHVLCKNNSRCSEDCFKMMDWTIWMDESSPFVAS